MVASHYRSPINYSVDLLNQCTAALERLYTCRENLEFVVSNAKPGREARDEEIKKRLEEYQNRFCEAMDEMCIRDRDYARRYASELFQRKYFARKRVEYELKQKGIDPDFIEELLEELEPEPVGQIGALVERKYLRALDDERGRRRTVAALQRLGYRWEDIRRALKEYEIPEG